MASRRDGLFGDGSWESEAPKRSLVGERSSKEREALRRTNFLGGKSPREASLGESASKGSALYGETSS
jgi:hypothetical protein